MMRLSSNTDKTARGIDQMGAREAPSRIEASSIVQTLKRARV